MAPAVRLIGSPTGITVVDLQSVGPQAVSGQHLCGRLPVQLVVGVQNTFADRVQCQLLVGFAIYLVSRKCKYYGIQGGKGSMLQGASIGP